MIALPEAGAQAPAWSDLLDSCKAYVLVLGAGGIVGQHMRLHQPKSVKAVYTRRRGGFFYVPVNIETEEDAVAVLERIYPDVVVNLLGENRPDVVERDPIRYSFVNARLPAVIGEWCDRTGGHLVHASTQGVYGGAEPPYTPIPPGVMFETPANAYGRQKLQAERYLADRCRSWTVARLTFVVGVRPLPTVGRANPFETMMDQLSGDNDRRQVYDRWFSVCFAHDAAEILWDLVLRGLLCPTLPTTWNVGVPVRVSRYELAKSVDVWGTNSGAPTPSLDGVSHDTFKELAQRPRDTTYAKGSLFKTNFDIGIDEAVKERWGRMNGDYAEELAMFFGCGIDAARARLGLGFGPNHVSVAEDWRAADPKSDAEILSWYRQTTAYCWELSAYHKDPGFNYGGMCREIAEHLRAKGVRHPLVLGDGIGDMTIVLREHKIDPIYHDLYESVTARFARFRFERRGMVPLSWMTKGWSPAGVVDVGPIVDAVIAHDFFEHMPNVEEWVRAIHGIMRQGGLFLAQNAFAIGDPEHGGSIPMHLSRNNVYADESPERPGVAGWDVLLDRVGFRRTGEGNWRVRV